MATNAESETGTGTLSALLSAVLLLWATGQTINIMTLGEMAAAVGLIIDDAIVMVENVHRHIDEGRTGFQASVLAARELGIAGLHNVANALAAALAAEAAGLDASAIARGLASFHGLPHRLELVREARGIAWINDSKATNVASTAVALRAMRRPYVLIAGGPHKGRPFTTPAPPQRAGAEGIGGGGQPPFPPLAPPRRPNRSCRRRLKARHISSRSGGPWLPPEGPCPRGPRPQFGSFNGMIGPRNSVRLQEKRFGSGLAAGRSSGRRDLADRRA